MPPILACRAGAEHACPARCQAGRRAAGWYGRPSKVLPNVRGWIAGPVTMSTDVF